MVVEENGTNKSSVLGQLDQSLLNGVLIYLLLATCSELNELSGIYIAACSYSFPC